MSRRIRIRTKLVAALAVPVVALLGVSAFEVVQASTEADDVRAQASLATSALGPGSLVTSLQDERNFGGLELIGLEEATVLPVSSTEEARANVDAAISELRALLAGQSPEVRGVFVGPLAELDHLEGIRADMDAYDGPRDLSNFDVADPIFTRYTEVVSAFFDATTQIALRTEDVSLRNGVELIDQSTRQAELRARMVRRVVNMVLTGATDDRAGQQELAGLYDRAQGYDTAIALAGVGRYEAAVGSLFEEEQVQQFNAQIEQFLATGEVEISELLAAVQTAPDIGYAGLRNRADTLLRERADQLVGGADLRQQAFLGLTGLVLLLAVAVTWAASRSITRPLRSLTTQAEAMAGEHLPGAVQDILDTPAGEDVTIPVVRPIEVRTRDEVRDVADALNVVQRSALDLAFEQAVLRRNISDSFVNLGRRNQNLLNRQLELITDLERDESDPDALEGLFRLDHLATRMRRNAESLLVLAGVDPPRQWTAPVAASDVVRAALGEVEDYQRVVVRHLEPAWITGTVAADLAHVIAELIENALSFSPPEQPVEVKGRLTPAGYTLAITDNGLGLADGELAKANRRLAGQESFTVAPSRYLGHYVAGHLAARMGVTVELGAGPAGGTTARIDVPMVLIADDDEAVPVDGLPSRSDAPRPVDDADQVVERWVAESRPSPGVEGWTRSSSAAEAPDVTTNGLPRRRQAASDAEGEWRTGDLPDERSPDPVLGAELDPAPAGPVAEVPPWETAPPVEAAPWSEAIDDEAPTVVDGWGDERDRDEAARPGDGWATDDVDSGVPSPHDDWRADPDERGAAPAVADWDPAPAAPPLEPAPAAPSGRSWEDDRDVVAPLWSTTARGAVAPVPGIEPPAHDDAHPAAGFGGLPSVDDSGSLPRRVPGAQRPDQPLDAGPGSPGDQPPRSSAEDVYAFLSSFQSGVERGLADAGRATEEDER